MRLHWSILLFLSSGCTALTSEPWDWLNEPAEQTWRNVRILGYGREITFSIPDNTARKNERPRSWPPFDDDREVQEVRVSQDSDSEQSITIAQYIWDRWWGGFYKESGHDFSLNVRVGTEAETINLLDLTPTERVAREVEFRENVYSGEGDEAQRIRDYFFERFSVKSIETKRGDNWVVHNNPAVTHDHRYYTIPISNQNILEFSFFVRDKRYGWKDDPEWNARRWALVEQIMDTVRIDPRPFP